jgi:hypothetical protein
VYSKKEVIIATVIALVIMILCVGSIVAAIMIASAAQELTPTPVEQIPLPAGTDDILSTFAATVIGGDESVSQFNADAQYVFDTSAIPCLIVLLVMIAVVIGVEYRNRKAEEKKSR